jgi:hypothetical protein
MTVVPKLPLAVLLAALAPATSTAQEGAERPQPVPYQAGFTSVTSRGDVEEWTLSGGVRYLDPENRLEIRCDRALLTLDAQETITSLRRLERESGLPRRAPAPPDARRALGEAALRARLADFLTALRRRPLDQDAPDGGVELFRSIYLEGDISVVREGVEVLRADRVYFSPLDDRAVLEGVLLRLRDVDATGNAVQVTVRTEQLIRQQGRFVGRDVSITTCPAGEPQFEVLSGEVEILERAEAFEIRTRDNVLALSRTPVLPLPNQSYVTGEQTNFPIRSASFGTSGREGMRAGVVVGGTFNELGGTAHEALTGRPAEEFRGDWQLGANWVEERGFPLDAEFRYSAADVYRGETIGFFLEDEGTNIRDIRRNLDGTLIDETERRIVRSENRFRLGERTEFDLTVFDASDPAAWSEFYRGRYYTEERPETSLHLRHGEDNWLATATGRFNLTSFSYDDSRRLTERFVEELPFVTLDWFSEPLLELPGDTPLLLTSSTGIAQLRSNFDDTVQNPVDDETLRLDQEIELAAPFHLGALAVRPYVDGRFTYFDETVAGGADGRWAFGAGIEFGSRFARSWNWLGEEGSSTSLRHVMSPTVRFDHRFAVSGDPTDFHQFDAVDALDEGASIRVGLLQRVQHARSTADGERDSREILWFDLAQIFTPISSSDDDGSHLGLLEFEFIARPTPIGENVKLGFGIEGEHDWDEDDLRTINNRVEVHTADVLWYAQYRADRTVRGQVIYGVMVPMRSRWVVGSSGVYDLEQKEHVRFLAQLSRRDLNWTVRVGLTYDAVTDDTSFRILFEPSFGGLVQPRGMWSGLDDPFVRAGALGF